MHIILVIFYINHWEHHVTLSFTPRNNNVWPVVLSASLQAFYTIYTAVLLFLTQRLAISRTLVHHLKLTAIHDITGAWVGFGSALNNVWQQTHIPALWWTTSAVIHDITGAWAGLSSALSSVWRQTNIPASWWTTFAVTAYLASISVLHVTSSTLLQFQTFNTSMVTSVPTTLGWPNDISYGSDMNWELMTASLPVVNHLPGLVTAGLSNTTLYDTIRTSSVGGNATVNATTITSCCGLLPNITLHGSLLMIDPFNIPGLSTTFCITTEVPWSDLIQVSQIFSCKIVGESAVSTVNPDAIPVPGIFLTVSALSDIEPSVQEEFQVNATWRNWSDENGNQTDDDIPIYIVLCSLSANPMHGVIDMQNNSLLSPVPIWQLSMQWEKYQWTKNDTWEAEMGRALSSAVSSGQIFYGVNDTNFVDPSITDKYIMTLVGLNLSAAYSQYYSPDSPDATFVVRLDKLELAVAKVVAQLIWLAGQLSASNEGLQPGNGMAYVNEELIALRLNINLLPLSFAAFGNW
ncbi:hypothetical protein DFH29DRAFT_1016108 [Suillus ampliporus]|nr:hypothetical protein DFH29DRAFT_1016108 [Suillus ampliporus]